MGDKVTRRWGDRRTRRSGDKENGRNGGKGSFEVRKLGRWKRGKKFQMVNEVPNPKNTDYIPQISQIDFSTGSDLETRNYTSGIDDDDSDANTDYPVRLTSYRAGSDILYYRFHEHKSPPSMTGG
jgi:hypothetical protein